MLRFCCMILLDVELFMTGLLIRDDAGVDCWGVFSVLVNTLFKLVLLLLLLEFVFTDCLNFLNKSSWFTLPLDVGRLLLLLLDDGVLIEADPPLELNLLAKAAKPFGALLLLLMLLLFIVVVGWAGCDMSWTDSDFVKLVSICDELLFVDGLGDSFDSIFK